MILKNQFWRFKVNVWDTTSWIQDLNWTYMTPLWTPWFLPIYVLCPKGSRLWFTLVCCLLALDLWVLLRVTFLVYFDRAIFYFFQLFHDGGPCHIETSPLISRTNQWTGFYLIGTFVLSSFWLFLSFIGVGIKVILSKRYEWIVTIAGVCLFSCRIVGRWYSSR